MLFPFHRQTPRKNPGAGPSAHNAIIVFLTIVAINMVRVAVTPPSPSGAASAPAVSLSAIGLALLAAFYFDRIEGTRASSKERTLRRFKRTFARRA